MNKRFDDFIGIAWAPFPNWLNFGWTKGYLGWDQIFWVGPLGFSWRRRGHPDG